MSYSNSQQLRDPVLRHLRRLRARYWSPPVGQPKCCKSTSPLRDHHQRLVASEKESICRLMRFQPSMAPPRAISGVKREISVPATAGPSGRLPAYYTIPRLKNITGNSTGASGTKLKRPAPESRSPPAKMPRLDTGSGRDASSRNTPVPRGNIRASEIKPLSRGSASNVFALQYLFHGYHGRDLEPFVVSHSAEVQPMLDSLQIARGVQWELVRGIKMGAWTWDDVKLKIEELKGVNSTVAPAVRNIMCGTLARSCTSHERSLWYVLLSQHYYVHAF